MRRCSRKAAKTQSRSSRELTASKGLFYSIVPDRLYRTCIEGFLAELQLFRALGLFVDVGISVLVIAAEVCRRSVAADIAVDTLAVDIKFAGRVIGEFV